MLLFIEKFFLIWYCEDMKILRQAQNDTSPPPVGGASPQGEALGKGDSEVAKYDVWICEEGLLKISAWARQGLSNEQIAENIGVSRKTFQEWLKKFPELKEAVKNSKEVADIHVENALFKKCLGYTVTVKKNMKIRTEGGIEEIVPVEEEVYVSPDVNAQKFWLQHRKAEDWGKAVEELSPEDEGGVVEIPGVISQGEIN